jgi:hypothetical protein
MVTITGRPAMRSPGRPPIHRDVERAFWLKVAEGLTSEEAAIYPAQAFVRQVSLLC